MDRVSSNVVIGRVCGNEVMYEVWYLSDKVIDRVCCNEDMDIVCGNVVLWYRSHG